MEAYLPQSGQVVQSFADVEVPRLVDRRLGSQSASFLIVLLDPSIFIVDVQRWDDSLSDHSGLEASRSSAANLLVKDQLNVVRTTKVQILADDSFKENTATDRLVKNLRQRELCLQDRKIIAISGLPIPRCERMGQNSKPLADQAVDLLGGEIVTNLLQAGRIVTPLALPPRESKDLGTLRLARGASVVGWVEEEDGKPSSGTRAELVPEDFGDVQNVVVNREIQRMKLESRSNDKGFFQIADVPPGRYVLTVSKEGFAPVRVQPVAVRPDLEAQMIDKLVLARPVIFEVVVDPPVEPYGKPWEIELLRRASPAGRHMDRIAGKVSQEGTWKSPGIPPGTYELGILGDLGTRWHSESVEIEPGEPALHVEIPVLTLRGTATIGDEPFPATVWLGREGRSLRFDSDAEGRFEGLLPEEGTWSVDVASQEENWRMSLDPVEVKVPRGKRFAEVAIEVPDTRLVGEVVDPAGRPVPGASVEASANQKRSSRRKTDEKGEFEIRGLPPGPVVASAESEGIESEAALVQLAEGVESPRLRLVLQRSRTVEGRVVSPAGGLPGARVFAWPVSGGPGASISEDVTRSDGSFRLEVRGEAALLNVLVLPPGYAFRMTTVLAEPGHKPEISVEANGGTLAFELSEGGGAPPLLVHNGVFVPLPLLDVWRRLQGDRSNDPRRIVVSQMEAGPYSLCVGAGAVASLRQGGEPPAASCSTGILSPFGELLLPQALRLQGRDGQVVHGVAPFRSLVPDSGKEDTAPGVPCF